ncbi:FAD-dependent oxidoreductase [Streptomyces sp. NPDC054961]
MVARDVDVLVVGTGVVGRSLAFALAAAEPSVRVVLAGDTSTPGPGGAGGEGASGAAGAMLGVLGEVTDLGMRTRYGRLRIELAVAAARRWPAWRDQVRARAGASAPEQDGYGTGTFMILNAVSSRLDDASFTAVARAAAEHNLSCHDTAAADIPGYRPLDNDRALRAWYMPDEQFLDARAWLATLDAALAAQPQVTRTPAGQLTAAPGSGYRLTTPQGVLRVPRAMVAAGSWTIPILQAIDPDLPVVPVLTAAGTAVTVTAPEAWSAVVRTPNRAYACGLHAVPQADGTLYLGASAHPALARTGQPTAGALRFLLDAALSQLDHHRDGLHASPLIATLLAAALLAPTDPPTPLPDPLAAFTPCRALIADLTAKEAAAEAAVHHAALAAEARMRPPLTGAWPQALTDAYAARMENAYAAMPEGYIPPPDVAPLAYEETGPALAELSADDIARHD